MRRITTVAVLLAAIPLCVSATAAGSAAAATTTPFGFGFTTFESAFTNADGSVDTQAGSHPAEASFYVHFKTHEPENEQPVAEVREVVTNLPPGVAGNPNATPQCTRAVFDRGNSTAASGLGPGECPPDTQVGTVTVKLAEFVEETLPLINLVPPANEPAELGVVFKGIRTFFNAFVRTNGDYGISVRVPNIPELLFVHVRVDVWGFPGAHTGAPLKPFWTMPSACGGPLATSATGFGWGHESELAEYSFLSESEGVPFGYTGCEHLRFTPSISITPESADAETPTGLAVELKEPQEGLSDPTGVAQSDIKTTTVVLPEGVTVNPGAAAGLGACQFSEDGVGTSGPPSCPLSSKIGTAKIVTPLLKTPLEGNVYLLQSSPPNVKVLLSAYAAGTYAKLVGDVTLNEATGQATVTFPETPQVPLSSATLSFGGGPQAALVTPPRCGTYGTTSDFTPWSTPFVGDALATDSFSILAAPGGGACLSALPFEPQLIAGSTTDQAGGYTGFSMLLEREDGQQRIAGLQFQTPEGLLGKISSVALCEEPQAALGECSAASQIGHTVVGAGPGPFPLFVPETGKPPAPIYLTGPYEGAPYGLAIVVPVVAGPFNLGSIVVRAKIEVNPHTSRLTITTNPATLPTILDGVPADIRDINVVIDRPEFMFNPTSCAPMSFTGTAYSTEGASAPLSSHFQVGSCRSLKFNPDFKVSTSSRTSRADGGSLTAEIVYPTGALGANQASSQSNIAQVKVELPKQLPARLTTLQKACPAATFEANPAGCPPASVVGRVKVLTPVLGVPLTGPAYFVSHGGEAFPSLVVVLQGSGITIDLVGSTFIGESGITSSTFKSVPDVPIGLFELTLPEGPYSALTANAPLCPQPLSMPTEFTGQNGVVLKRDTPIEVEGCSNTLSFTSHSIQGRTLTVSVYAPAAGKLLVGGNGLKSVTKTAKRRETITFKLMQKRAGRLKTTVQATFAPSTGKVSRKQAKTLRLQFRK